MSSAATADETERAPNAATSRKPVASGHTLHDEDLRTAREAVTQPVQRINPVVGWQNGVPATGR